MPWNGEAILAYLACAKHDSIAEFDRCVNEGTEGCAVRAEENGWCGPCWRTIAPAS